MKTDFELSHFFTFQITVLKLCGVWFYIPYSIKNVRFWLALLIRVLVATIVFIIPPSSQFIYIVKLFLSGNAQIHEVAAYIHLVMTESLVPVKFVDMYLRRDILIQLTEQVMDNEFQIHLKHHKNQLEKASMFSKKVFWILLISSGMDIFVHDIVVPGLQNFEVLPMKMDMIWIDINKKEYHNYAYAYQVLFKPLLVISFTALHTFAWAAMMFTMTQLDILTHNLENMKDLIKKTMKEKQCDSNTAFKEVFKGCVIHHSSILRFVKTFEKAFGGQFTSTFCMCGVIVCTSAVQIISIQSPLKNIVDVMWVVAYLSIFVGIMFVDCYFGNIITIKGLNIATVVFSYPWIELPPPLKKNIMIFIAKTQQPIVITAAKVVPISLRTFTKCVHRILNLFYAISHFYEQRLFIWSEM